MDKSDGLKESKSWLAQVHWSGALFLTLTPLVLAAWLPSYLLRRGWGWRETLLLVITYSISNLVITSGYHRYFAHRSFRAHPFVEFLFWFIGAGAFQGSVYQWVMDHRRHHRDIDTDGDPYNIRRGFWFAHLGWMYWKGQPVELQNVPRDLAVNRGLQFQFRHYGVLAFAVGFGIPMLIGSFTQLGWEGGLLVGGLLRTVLSQHSTFLINSAAHMFGVRPYLRSVSACDNGVLAVLTFGEGYHNFHHRFQADFRNGIRWYQWDPTKWLIQSLAIVRLADRLRRVPSEEILKARLATTEEELVHRGANRERLKELRERIEAASRRWRALRSTQSANAVALKEAWAERKAELALARREFLNAMASWRAYTKAWAWA